VHLFETQRLIGRQLSRQDLPELTDILSDPEVMKYSVRGVCDENATRDFIDWCLECYVSHEMGPLALVDKGSDELVGFCGVGPEMVDGIEEANLGYRLAKRYWNKGIASEAAKGVLEYTFGRKKLASVVVIIEPEHVASLRVAENAGFNEFSDLEFHGRLVRLYRLTCQQWDALHNNALCSIST